MSEGFELKKRLTKWLFSTIAVILFIGLLFFLLRGPYLSNSIKRAILPVLEQATGEKVIIDKAAINLFPFYLQAKGLKVFDKDGNKLLGVTKARAYIDFSGLFFKEIRIRRLTIKEPDLTIEKQELQRIINSIKSYLSEKKGEDINISVRSARMMDGKFVLSDGETQSRFYGTGFYSEMVVKDTIAMRLLLKDGGLKLPELPELSGSLEGAVRTDGKQFEVLEAKVYSSGSTLNAKGRIHPSVRDRGEWGKFSGEANILAETLRKVFNLKKKKDGELSFYGSVDLGVGVSLNLKTKGWFYLETLMEMLKVKEDILGLISMDGKIHGVYPDLVGEAKVTLKNGMLDTLPLNDVAGTIRYENKKFSLEDFIAHTYGGELKGKAYLFIPHGSYSVIADVRDIRSPEFLKFINWEPPFPEGRLSGNFELKKIPGREFDVGAVINYINTSNEGTELKDRLKNIEGRIDLREGVLTITDSRLSTSNSTLFLNGNIDLKGEKLNLNLGLKTQDAMDLTMPHYDGLRAVVKFKGVAKGSFVDPEISGDIDIEQGSINGVPFTKASGDLTYSMKILSVGTLRIEACPFGLSEDCQREEKAIYDISGNIKFKKADKLFSFDSPYYDATAIIKNGDASSLIRATYRKLPITGSLNGVLSFKGDAKEFSGNGDVTLSNGTVFGQSVDHSIFKATLSPQKIDFTSIEVFKAQSRLNARGSLYLDRRFDAIVTSDNIELKDITYLRDLPLNARLTVNIKGEGTLREPDVKFSMKVLESNLRGAEIGRGIVSGELKEKKFSVKGSFLEGLLTAQVNGIFSKPLLWDINMDLKKGSYDFLLRGLLKDAPKDTSASLEGSIRVKGQGDKISMESIFSFMNFSLYGYNFTNKGNVVFKLDEKEFMIKPFSLTGRDTDISVGGTVRIGKTYNITIEGKTNLEPLRAVSKGIESLKGHGDFLIQISGVWGEPELSGKINIRGSTVMFAGFPHKIGPLSGDIFLNKDRITLDSLNADFGGGNVTMSGIAYMKGLSIKRLSLSSNLSRIKLRPQEGVSVAFDGRLFYDFSQKGKTLTGDIHIKKARYEKRVEWGSGVLALRELKRAKIMERPFLAEAKYLGETRLNIHIVGQDNISIDNNIARAPVKIDLTLKGTPSQYGLLGRVTSKGGSVFFRGNEFKIIDGSVDFVEHQRIAPVFHIQAETFTKGYRVRVNLDGPPEKFALTLSSNPPLTDTDIFSLLTVGQIARGAKGVESGIGAAEATAFLTGRLQDVMEERFKYITGFDRFEINPHTTAKGMVSPRVTVGKRLLKEKVSVTYSTAIGTTEEHVVRLEYNLDKNIALVGSRDERGSVGGDIKFRFEFK